MLTVIVVIVFVLGLAMFIRNLPDLKKAAKEGWAAGKAKKK